MHNLTNERNLYIDLIILVLQFLREMLKFSRGLFENECEDSREDSYSESDLHELSDDDDSFFEKPITKKQKRMIKIPGKLLEYETEDVAKIESVNKSKCLKSHAYFGLCFNVKRRKLHPPNNTDVVRFNRR